MDGSFTSSALDGEEKKESPMMIGSSEAPSPPHFSLGDPGEPSTPLTTRNRRSSDSSVYLTPAASSEIGDCDDVPALRLPLQATMSSSNKVFPTSLRGSIGGGKKKDLLEVRHGDHAALLRKNCLDSNYILVAS